MATRANLTTALERAGVLQYEEHLRSLGVASEDDLTLLTVDDLKEAGLPTVAARRVTSKYYDKNRHSDGKQHRLPKDLPKWKPSEAISPLQHLTSLVVILTAVGLPEDAWPAALAVTLTAHGSWAMKNLIESKPSWTVAKEMFLARFGLRHDKDLKRAELTRCRQRGRSIEQYVTEFESLAAEAEVQDNEEFAMTLFTEGLDSHNRSLFKIIVVSEEKTLPNLFSLAIEHFHHHASFRPSALSSNPSKSRPHSAKKCSYHGECGHTTAECQVLKNKTTSGKNGNSRFSSEQGQGPRSQFSYRPSNANNDISKITCFKCGKTGHYANKCTQQRQVPSLNAIFSEHELQVMMQPDVPQPPRSEN